MTQIRKENFFNHLATICQESYPANWHDSLQKVLALFGAANQAQEAALWLLHAGHTPDFCLQYAENGPAEMCARWDEVTAAQPQLTGLQSLTLPNAGELWLLPIPPRSSPSIALLALVNPAELLPEVTLEQAAALLTPLVQLASSSQESQAETCDPAFDVIERYRLLTQSTQTLGNIVDGTEMLRRVGDITLEVMQADRIAILPLEKYESRRKYQPHQSDSPLDFISNLYQQHTELLDGSNRFVHLADAWEAESKVLAALARRERFHTALAIPLQVHQRPLGLIAMYRNEIRPFSIEEINLGKALATQAALALNNVYLFLQEQDQRDLANAMAQATTALAQTLDQDQVFDQILEQVTRVVAHEASNVMLIEDGHARVVRWRGYEQFHIAEHVGQIRYPLTLPNFQAMLETRAPVTIPDTHAHADWVYQPGFEWLRSYTAVPIIIGEEVMGFINIDSTIPGFFTEKHTQRLQTFAHYTAIAIQNAKLYQAAQQQTAEVARLLTVQQKRQSRLEHLNTVIAAVNSMLDLDSILQTGLEQALKIAEMVRGRIYIYDKGAQELRLRVYLGVPERDLDFFSTYTPGQGTTGRAFADQQVLVENDPTKARTAFLPESMDELQAQISVPLIVENQAVGVISLNTSRGHDITPEVEQLIRAIADQLALAIQRGQLTAQMQEQLQTVHYLYELSAAFLSQMDTRGIIFVLLRTLNDLIGETLGTAFYQLEAGRWQRARVYTALGKSELRERWTVGAAWSGEEVNLDACRREHTLVSAGRSRSKLPAAWQRFSEMGIQQMLYFPLALPNREFFGVVGVAQNKEYALTPYETALSGAVVQQGAAALARIHLYEASREGESRLHAILESSRDGILLVGHEQSVRYVNGQALKFLTLPESPKAWEHRPLKELIAATRDEATQFACWLETTAQQLVSPEEACADGDPPTFETRRGLFLNLHHWPVYSERNELLGALFLLRDVTEQQALEQMRDELLNMIVHDMRNPLAVVQNALQILQDPLLYAETDEIIDIAYSNIDGLLNLVNTILELGQMESGHFDLYQEALALTEHLEVIVHNIAVPNEALCLEIAVAPTLPLLWFDPKTLTRILQNLLSNARKFIPETEGRIHISAREEGDWIEIEVYNNGPHIPAETYARLFQKFSAGKYKKRGYGLGLAYCRLAVEAHGGRIWAINQPEGGVSFYFTLPTMKGMLERVE